MRYGAGGQGATREWRGGRRRHAGGQPEHPAASRVCLCLSIDCFDVPSDNSKRKFAICDFKNKLDATMNLQWIVPKFLNSLKSCSLNFLRKSKRT